MEGVIDENDSNKSLIDMTIISIFNNSFLKISVMLSRHDQFLYWMYVTLKIFTY